MRELEFKYREVNDPSNDLEQFLGSLWPEAKVSDVAQIDRVFVRARKDLTEPSPGTIVARIRVSSPGGASCTVKVRRGRDLDREEHNFGIDDPDAAADALLALGLAEAVTVRKSRRTWRLDERRSVTLDDVVGLGRYVELEILGNEDEQAAETALLSLRKCVETYRGSLAPETRGYDRILLETAEF